MVAILVRCIFQRVLVRGNDWRCSLAVQLMSSDNAGRSPSLRTLILWWLLLMVLPVPGWFLVGYGLLTASLSIHLAGCFWAGFAYSPAMLALIGQRHWLPAMDWWNDSWRQLVCYVALTLFSLVWYGLLIGSGIWRFG